MFYMTPPKGFSSYSTLKKDIKTRFIFLFKVVQFKGEYEELRDDITKNPQFCYNLDCLIEGSKRDIASHFIFRLACLKNVNVLNYWIAAEKELFKYRLKLGGNETLYTCIASLLSDARQILSNQFLLDDHRIFLCRICTHLSSLVSNSELLFCDDRNNCQHYIYVPWNFVLSLVANREVEVNKGSAKIPCFLIHNFLASLFSELLYKGTAQLKHFGEYIYDTRIDLLTKNIHFYFINYLNKGLNGSESNLFSLNHEKIEKEVDNFPLCMQQLHKQLKATNRLTHHERFRYSLFLKDIGMPLEESVKFWKQYYSLPPKCSHSGCQHLWSGSAAKKYEYSLRHMYGLEGKRISYRSHSCSVLQDLKPQPQECGGCPFKSLERDVLCNVISNSKNLWPRQIDKITNAAENENPSLACGLFLSSKLHRHIPKRKKLLRFSSHCSSTKNVNTKPIRSFKKCSTFDVYKDLEDREVKFLKRDIEKPLADYLQIVANVANEREAELSCFDCNFFAIPPKMSFLSAKDYYNIVKMENLLPKL